MFVLVLVLNVIVLEVTALRMIVRQGMRFKSLCPGSGPALLSGIGFLLGFFAYSESERDDGRVPAG